MDYVFKFIPWPDLVAPTMWSYIYNCLRIKLRRKCTRQLTRVIRYMYCTGNKLNNSKQPYQKTNLSNVSCIKHKWQKLNLDISFSSNLIYNCTYHVNKNTWTSHQFCISRSWVYSIFLREYSTIRKFYPGHMIEQIVMNESGRFVSGAVPTHHFKFGTPLKFKV